MSGDSASVPTTYQPAWSAGADQTYQNLQGTTAAAAGSLPGQVQPGAYTAATNIANNPYASGALAGAGAASQFGTALGGAQGSQAAQFFGSVGTPLAAGQGLSAQAGQVGGQAQGYLNQAQGLFGQGAATTAQGNQAFGYAAGAQGAAQQVYGNAATPIAAGNQAYGQAGAATPYMNQILQTGFDPQSALYDRTQQQIQDQTNAINAMNGVAGSPYGAGLSAQANSNFNIDWQNQQLQRQATALQGYGTGANAEATLYGAGDSAYGAAAGQYGASQGFSGVSQGFDSAASGLYGAAQGYYGQGSGLTTDANNLFGSEANLYGAASGQYGAASGLAGVGNQLGNDAYSTMLSSSQLPYQTFLGQQTDAAKGYSDYASTVGKSLSPATSDMSSLLSYLGTGQSATSVNQNAQQIQNQQDQAFWNGIGQLFGTGAQLAMMG